MRKLCFLWCKAVGFWSSRWQVCHAALGWRFKSHCDPPRESSLCAVRPRRSTSLPEFASGKKKYLSLERKNFCSTNFDMKKNPKNQTQEIKLWLFDVYVGGLWRATDLECSLGLKVTCSLHSLKHTASLMERRQIVRICFIAVNILLLPMATAVVMVRQTVISLCTSFVICVLCRGHLEQVTELQMLSLCWEF